MQISTIILGLAFAASVIGTPVAHQLAARELTSWNVTGFQCTGTSMVGCGYAFNITKDADTSGTTLYSEPAINTYC